MATYPEGNPGAYPIDPGTQVGQLRILLGDVYSEPYDPPEPGFQNYTEFSDAELDTFIAQGGGSVTRGAAWAYVQMAAAAAKESVSVADYDLRADLTKRSADLRAIAQLFFDQADTEDAGSEDAFLIVPTGKQPDFIPELSIPIWGRRYSWDRWER